MAFSDFLTHSLPAVGQLAFGPVGAGAGTILAGALGQAGASDLERQAKAAQGDITSNSPGQIAQINDVTRRERAFSAGTDPITSNAIRQTMQAGSMVGYNLLRAGGADVTQNLLRNQSATQQAIGRHAAAGADGSINLLALKGRLIDNAQERTSRDMKIRADNLMAQAAVARQDSRNNMLAGVPFLPQLGIGTKKTTPVSPFMEIFGETLSGAQSRGGSSSLGSGYQLGDLTNTQNPINFGFGYQ